MSQDAEKLVEEGIAFYKNGEKENAFASFNKAIELDPQKARAYGNRGRIYFEQSKFNKALKDLQRAIELDDSTRIVPSTDDEMNDAGSLVTDLDELPILFSP